MMVRTREKDGYSALQIGAVNNPKIKKVCTSAVVRRNTLKFSFTLTDTLKFLPTPMNILRLVGIKVGSYLV